jgi:hypothetical protein
MSCNLTSGIQLGCRDNVGGLKTVWITDFCNVDSITQSTGDTITQISGTGTFYCFELIRTSSQHTETVNASLEAGTVFYQGETVLYFSKLEQAKRNILKTLAQSQRLAVVAEDNNGSYFYLGQTYGCFVSAGTSVTGKALGDANGYNITLQYLEPNPMNELSGTLSSVVAGISVGSCGC